VLKKDHLNFAWLISSLANPLLRFIISVAYTIIGVAA